ncbi:MAG: NusA N-terminal domain-containing protein, partial [Rhizomicrobium sp.]
VQASYPRPELLAAADQAARDKGIDRDEVLQAMEQAIQKAGRSKYGQEYDIRAEIDRKSGEIRLLRFRGRILGVEGDAAKLLVDEAPILLPLAHIARAKHVLTDELLAAHQSRPSA